MAIDTTWKTAPELLESLNFYRRMHPEIGVINADHRDPEPTLTWVASDDGMVLQTWSIPIRLFEATMPGLNTGSIEKRIQALKLPPTDLRVRSGVVSSQDRLVSFLYTLMRDHLTAGEVEAIVQEEVEPFADQVVEYSNGWLAEYAKDVAKRLR